jgi:hypothetical protein
MQIFVWHWPGQCLLTEGLLQAINDGVANARLLQN